MSHALIPGSFDPMTLGHLDIIKRACAHYDKVTVAVMINEKKKYTYSLEERTEIARLTLTGLPNVALVSDTGLLVDLFDRIGADVIVKGLRNERDRAYEEEMAAYNLARNPRAKTVFMQAADDLEEISSTRARSCLASGEPTDDLLSPHVIAYLKEKEARYEGSQGL